MAASVTLVLAEVVAPGRQARGEEPAYERFSSLAEVWRPGGQLLSHGWGRLVRRDRLHARGRLGGFGAVGSLYVVSQGCASDSLAEALSGLSSDLAWAGASELPNRAGVWMRVLARDSPWPWPQSSPPGGRLGWLVSVHARGVREALKPPEEKTTIGHPSGISTT